MAAQPVQNVRSKAAVIGARFDQLNFALGKFIAQPLGKLKCQQLAEKRSGGRTGKKIAVAPDPARFLIIAQARRVEGRVHKLGKSDWAVRFYLPLKIIRQIVHSLALLPGIGTILAASTGILWRE